MIDGSHPSHSSHSSSSDDRIRRKIEALGNSLSLPTVRKALGVLEGEHASNRRGGNDDPMDIRVYGPGDEARLIDWKASARLGRPMVVQHARQATSQVWLLCDVGEEMTGGCASGEPAYAVAGNALRMFAALSLRRSDDVSLVFADAHSITRMPFNGGVRAVRAHAGRRLAAGLVIRPQHRRSAGLRAPHTRPSGAHRACHRRAGPAQASHQRHRRHSRHPPRGADHRGDGQPLRPIRGRPRMV